ncbi:VOC family protein [Streptosporangium sp. NPDC051022]|uniref:VOC family protein n=1 Tax=Streptosporangium sp. NPDC051022 TaxID=3155752 RepID=UPI0034253B7C
MDLSSTDVTLSVRFYRELFGWEAVFDPRPESGGYGRFTLDGKVVAGIGPGLGDGVPSVWNTYVATGDAEATASAVRAAGGGVELEPARAFGEGVVTAFQDPSGAFLMAWQAGRPAATITGITGSTGIRDAVGPGRPAWSELVTREAGVGEAFYRAVFDWSLKDDGLPGAPYARWHLHGRPVAGAVRPEASLPPDTPSHWRACFAVGDAAAAVERVRDLGGAVLVPPAPTPAGRRAVVADPQFAVFGLIEPGGAP